MKVHKLLVAVIVVPRPFPSGVVAAGHIEGVRSRSSGLGGVLIRVSAVHRRALILPVLRAAVQELVGSMFLILFVFIMFGVAGPLLHGPSRRLLVWHLWIVPTHLHLFALIPRHRPRCPPCGVMLIRPKRCSLVQRDWLLLLRLLLLLLLLLLLG